MAEFLAVCLNPTFQKTISLKSLTVSEINRAVSARLDASGKGVNVARVLRQLGAGVTHLTHLGKGRQEFLELCAKDKIDVVYAESNTATRTCITLLDTKEKTTTEIIEPTEPVSADTVKKIIGLYKEQLDDCGFVILSGSKAPGYPDNLFSEFARMAFERKIPVIADYRGADLEKSLEYSPYIVKINLVEFAETFLPEITVTESDVTKVLKQVIETLSQLSAKGIRFVVTRGSRPVIIAENSNIKMIEPPEIIPVNTIGSGDSVTAGIAWAINNGSDLRDAVKKGIECGSKNAVLLKPGSITG